MNTNNSNKNLKNRKKRNYNDFREDNSYHNELDAVPQKKRRINKQCANKAGILCNYPFFSVFYDNIL